MTPDRSFPTGFCPSELKDPRKDESPDALTSGPSELDLFTNLWKFSHLLRQKSKEKGYPYSLIETATKGASE